MKIYAVIGQSMQTILPDDMTYTPAPDEVLMVSERPDGDYIAKEDGTWEEYTPEVVPTTEERVEALEQADADMNDIVLGLVDIIDGLMA